jgi:hypothetical protein
MREFNPTPRPSSLDLPGVPNWNGSQASADAVPLPHPPAVAFGIVCVLSAALWFAAALVLWRFFVAG